MGSVINSIPALQPLSLSWLQPTGVQASVLRLDELHPVISGNKWYKLKEYLAHAEREKIKTLVTFGGAFSNHILATAAACTKEGIEAIGIIRGEAPAQFSSTLSDAQALGMLLFFVSRETYRNKVIPVPVLQKIARQKFILVPEGGYGIEGMRGAAMILRPGDIASFSHIMCAVGTGTTLAGLVQSALPHQQVLGVSVMKNNEALEAAVCNLLPPEKHNRFRILHEHHWGGYAKHRPQLFHFMNEWFRHTGIRSDFVYTGKLFAAFAQLCTSGFFPMGSNVLLMHSGGLQGNRSLPPGTLIF